MLPVNRIWNQEMTAITCTRIPNPYSTIRCGMAINQLTNGRQFVTFSAGSTVNVAGYGAAEDCMSLSHQLNCDAHCTAAGTYSRVMAAGVPASSREVPARRPDWPR